MDPNQELAKKLISNGHNLVLTGQGGTGKTYIIQSSIHEILIGSTGPGVSYKLRNVYSVSWYCWNIATYEWEIYNWKIEVVSFVV